MDTQKDVLPFVLHQARRPWGDRERDSGDGATQRSPPTSPRSRMKQSPVLKLAQLRSRSLARMFFLPFTW